MNREETEIRIWEYIDGGGTEAERQRVCVLIATDDTWKQLYREATAFDRQLATNLETEEPSLRFVQNVMDTIAKEHIAPATGKYINKRVITGISVFFLSVIASGIGFAVWKLKPGVADGVSFPVTFRQLNFSLLFNTQFLYGIVIINIVLGLVFLDSALQKKRRHDSMISR